MSRAPKRGRKVPGRRSGALSDTDIQIWRRLIRRAHEIAASPQSRALSFVTAAEKAGGVPVLPGQLHDDSACVRLVRLGKRFLTLSADDRAAAAADIRAMASEIEDMLEALDAASTAPRRPYRED